MWRRITRWVAGSDLTAMICFTYLCMALAWVFVAELVNERLALPVDQARYARASGVLFAVVSTLAIFLLYGRSEKRLRAREQHYRTIVETTRDGICLLDRGGVITYANPRMAEMLGCSPSELVGRAFKRFVDERYAPGLEAYFRALPGNGAEHEEVELRRPDGAPCWAVVSAAPVRDGENRVAGTVAVVTDTTTRRQAENAQRLAAVGQLAAGVAHEFNNILVGMLMQAELAAMRDQTGSTEPLVKSVKAGAERGASICKRLMTFARPSSPRLETVAIEQTIEAALGLLEAELRASDVQVLKRFAPHSCAVRGDSAQLQQVFTELFLNALHAMPSGGTLTVTTQCGNAPEGGSCVEIAVQDTGDGIHPEHVSRLFEPFFTTKGVPGESEVPGSGLGLSAAHGIVTAHGGRFQVRTAPGQGSTFTLILPGGAAHQTEEPPPPIRRARPSARTCQVLVADDEEEIRGSLEQVLSISGYAVTTARDATEALAEMERGQVDLVVTDLLMPGGGGRAVLNHVAERGGDIPVVVITGKLEGHVAQELAALGACACLQKPFTFQELLDVVSQALPDGTAN